MKMDMSRCFVAVWLLAVSCLGTIVSEPDQMNVTVGENVILPCPCHEDTNKFVWQIGEDIVVNHCCKEKHPLHEDFINRTHVFLLSSKQNCSLLLHDVSLKDQNTFTCYFFAGTKLKGIHNVKLNVEGTNLRTDANPDTGFTERTYTAGTPNTYSERRVGFSVGVPLSLILVILAGLIVALVIRKRLKKRPRMVMIQEPKAEHPVITYSPVLCDSSFG